MIESIPIQIVSDLIVGLQFENTPSQQMRKASVQYKFVLGGVCGVGKSAILARLITNEFSDRIPSTITGDLASYHCSTPNEDVQLQIWDTAGQERYRAASQHYFRGAVGVALVFALNDRASFDAIHQLLKDIRELVLPEAAIILVGNKSDLPDRQVTEVEASDYAKRQGLEYIETSAKSNRGIQETFTRLVRSIGEKRANGKLPDTFYTQEAKELELVPEEQEGLTCPC
jgi:small GTP-binding protein